MMAGLSIVLVIEGLLGEPCEGRTIGSGVGGGVGRGPSMRDRNFDGNRGPLSRGSILRGFLLVALEGRGEQGMR